MDHEAIGKYIASLRKQQHLTQQQLADRLGVTNKAVSKWETAEGLPDISILPALAEVLGTSVDAILSGGKASPVQGYTIQPAKTAATGDTSNETARYLLEKQMQLFACGLWVSLGLLMLGLVAAAAIWYEQQNGYAFGIGLALQIAGWVLFEVMFTRINHQIASYNRQGFGAPAPYVKRGKYYALGIWFLAVLPCGFVFGYGSGYIPFPFSNLVFKGVRAGCYLLFCSVFSYCVWRRR